MTTRIAERIKFSLISLVISVLLAKSVVAQDNEETSLEDIEIAESRTQLCFGFSDIKDARALAICNALRLEENVKARELSENWISSEPDSPAAQFVLADILFAVEGNLPRALFHLNQAEALTDYKSMDAALNSGNVQWHYLTLSQISHVHQLMGDQLKSLEYLEKISEIYGIDTESSRGWPLIKLKQYAAAEASAIRVLESSENELERSRAWNTLCAAQLASLKPIASTSACDQAISEEENIADNANDYDTVYLTNASEVSLSLLKMEQAEKYLDRATRFLDPNSVADPWIYKLFLTMNQGRFDDAKSALDRMLIWRQQQKPIVNVMNRAEHFLVSASFLMLAGYTEDSIKLTQTALNQPDRNGSYSADDKQKDSFAAILNMMANRAEYQIQLERLASSDLTESLLSRFKANRLRIDAWLAKRRAAALFADFDTLQNRLRPYAPLDVHIPEWIEPEIIDLIGTGVMSTILEQAKLNGAFQLNEGYYYSYLTEIEALENNSESLINAGEKALEYLPQQEVLLRARVQARMAAAHWLRRDYLESLSYFESAFEKDPSIIRRLQTYLPVSFVGDDTEFSETVEDYLNRSPRFRRDINGLRLEIKSSPDLSICLKSRSDKVLSCYTLPEEKDRSNEWKTRELARRFHTNAFGLGYEISKAQRSILLGSSVILSSQSNRNLRNSQDAFLIR